MSNLRAITSYSRVVLTWERLRNYLFPLCDVHWIWTKLNKPRFDFQLSATPYGPLEPTSVSIKLHLGVLTYIWFAPSCLPLLFEPLPKQQVGPFIRWGSSSSLFPSTKLQILKGFALTTISPRDIHITKPSWHNSEPSKPLDISSSLYNFLQDQCLIFIRLLNYSSEHSSIMDLHRCFCEQ